ncbi:MAG: 16S rRNA (uracil(1498)-N(3))-methyltransferase, partial [Pirellulaceae bacterium]
MSIKQPRFFVEKIGDSSVVTVVDDEAHHLIHVLRIQVGDSIVVFDGNGPEFDAEVVSIGKKDLSIRLGERRDINRELNKRVVIAVSLPKGDRQKVLVEKLVELGASELVPLVAQRSVAQPTDSAIARLEKQVIAASKQCGRNRLMKIAKATSLKELVSREAGNVVRLICDPSGKQTLKEYSKTASDCLVAIGPEGGFTEDELEAARAHGWQVVNLGPRILRVETAAVAAAVEHDARDVRPVADVVDADGEVGEPVAV